MLLNPFTRTPAKIAVLGLGYVGLPLAVAFAARHEVVGFDLEPQRAAELARTLGADLEAIAHLDRALGLWCPEDGLRLRAELARDLGYL